MGKHILQIIACYIVGIIAGNLIFMPYTGPLAIAFIIVGAVLTLPILVLVLLTFAAMRNTVLRNLSLWCLSAPFFVILVWLALEWEFNYSNRGHDIYWYQIGRAHV